MKLFFALLLLPSLAWSGSDTFATCQFDSECIEGEACDATDFQLTVVHGENEEPFTLQTMSETIYGYSFDNGAPDWESHLIANTETAYHMLTIGVKGDARYTVHMQGPMVISYMGKCQVEDVVTD